MSGAEEGEDAIIETAINRGGTIYSSSDQMRVTGLLIRRVQVAVALKWIGR